MYKIKLLLTGLVLLVFVGAGCNIQNSNNQNKQVENKEPIKIGFIGPLSGDIASLGENIRDAVMLAEQEINETGGINGRIVKVIYENGACATKEAINATNKLVNQDKVKFIVGGICSGETLAAAPIVEAGQVILISPASTNPDITNSGDYIFRLMPSDLFQGKFVGNYIKNTLGKTRVAILYNSDQTWSTGIKDQFKKKFLELGGEIVAEEGVLTSSHDLRLALSKIKSANPELIYFPSLIDSGIIGLRQIREQGIEIPVLGGDVWDDTKIATEAGVAAEGARFTIAANRVLPQEYLDNMKKLTGSDEVNTYAPRAYDALKIFAKLIAEVGDDSTKVKEALYQLKDYQGVADTYTLDENGDVSVANYTIKEFKDGKIVNVN